MQTFIDDYIYRPRVYDGVDLYRWIQCSHRHKRNKTESSAFDRAMAQLDHDDTSNYMDKRRMENLRDSAFLPDHPLYLSHAVSFDIDKEKTQIPNFIGPALPKRHEELDDYYCSVMLTLFKPWRSGFDLKRTSESWRESFIRYDFTKDQRKKMTFFNLRYECYDARDEYSHVLKQRKAAAGIVISKHGDIHSSDLNGNTMAFDDISIDNQDAKDGESGEADDMCLDSDGYTYGQLRHLQQTDCIANGASFDAPSSSTKNISLPAVIVDELSAARWRNILKIAKEQVATSRLEQRRKRSHDTAFPQPSKNTFEGVQIIDRTFLNRDFVSRSPNNICDKPYDTIAHFALNEDQQRAFLIVANHVLSASSEQLMMYLGGMAGTGKSRVLNATQAFFGSRNETHRILVLAPTGSTAALVRGWTYHSALGIGTGVDSIDGPRNDVAALRRLRTQLEGVTHIFIDEISMISCHELYAISSRLSQATNVHDKPFGGLNVILAGDFAQLDPAKGAALYSGSVSMINKARQKPREQMNTIGKLIWHQFTIVVILKENMRQRNQTDDDAALRRALVNMRYGACTTEDLNFLRSRVVPLNPKIPNLTDPQFRNISVITPLNVQKDRLNERGCIRFGSDTEQSLEHFYSVDSDQHGRPLPRNIQQCIWKMPANETGNVAGKLSLCRGMPVMIHFNYATELCITRGQEAHVVSWTDTTGPSGQRSLETLFVRLHNPPVVVQLPNLPENVVPITKHRTNIVLTLSKTDVQISLWRQQVQILPNFAMTDYAAQGKSRPRNPVNLTNCKNQNAVYTSLSRSTTAEGTLILGDFDTNKITKGISGFLRQEFRELELLNCITKDRFLGKTPCLGTVNLRKPIIRRYQLAKGPHFEPGWHKALCWHTSELRIEDPKDTYLWTNDLNITTEQSRKKRKTDPQAAQQDNVGAPVISGQPVGLVWDSKNWSCAYDALLSIMYNVWVENRLKISAFLQNMGPLASEIANGFNKKVALETLRDNLRVKLHVDDPIEFPYGHVGTDLYSLVKTVFGKRGSNDTAMICETCDNLSIEQRYDISEYVQVQFSLRIDHDLTSDVQDCLALQLTHFLWCAVCGKPSRARRVLENSHQEHLPVVMFIPLPDNPVVRISHELRIKARNPNKEILYSLRGIIYHGSNHFTCRIIDQHRQCWNIDGHEITVLDSSFPATTWFDHAGRKAAMAVYVSA